MNKRLSVDCVEKFIDLVRQYSYLYDTTDRYYKDAQKHRNTWDSIAHIMQLKGMSGEDWKKKWRNHRDMYVKKHREIHSNKSDHAVFKAQQWPFLDTMSFLDNYNQETKSEINVLNNDGEEDMLGDVDERSGNSITSKTTETAVGIIPSTPSTSTPSSSASSTCTPLASPQKYKKRRNDEQENIDEALVCLINDEQKARAIKNSAGELFLESCAIRMQQLPDNIKSYVQLQISQIFFNAENPEYAVPIIPLPSNDLTYK